MRAFPAGLVCLISIFGYIYQGELEASGNIEIETQHGEDLNIEQLHEYFDKISVIGGSLLLKASIQAPDRNCDLNGDFVGRLKPGAVFKLPILSTFEVYQRAGAFTISPLPEPYHNRGFYVASVTNPHLDFIRKVQLAILLIGDYNEGVKVSDGVYLIGSDFNTARRLLNNGRISHRP